MSVSRKIIQRCLETYKKKVCRTRIKYIFLEKMFKLLLLLFKIMVEVLCGQNWCEVMVEVLCGDAE